MFAFHATVYNPSVVCGNTLATGLKYVARLLNCVFWDERHLHDPGWLFDHSYESIKALPGLGIYELRLDDDIGGQSNIRVVFFDPPKDWKPEKDESRPLKIVWVLEAMPKRRDEWTRNDLMRFKTARLLIQERFYLT